MVRGKTDHAPKPSGMSKFDEEDFIRELRQKRNRLEYQAKNEKDDFVRQKIKSRVHQFNVMIEEFGYSPYAYRKHGAKSKTTQVCKRCGEEKSVDDFQEITQYYKVNSGEMRSSKSRRKTCMTCQNKNWHEIKKRREFEIILNDKRI